MAQAVEHSAHSPLMLARVSLCGIDKITFHVCFRGHGPDQHHYPNSMNHAGHAHTYSGPPPSILAAQMAAGHGPRGGSEHDSRSRTMMAYQGGTLGRTHHQQVPLPPPPTEAMNGGSMSLPPMDYRYKRTRQSQRETFLIICNHDYIAPEIYIYTFHLFLYIFIALVPGFCSLTV